MDEIDLASAYEEAMRRQALALHQQQVAGSAPARWARGSVRACVECGEAISEARRRAVPGVQRCVECQTRAESGSR